MRSSRHLKLIAAGILLLALLGLSPSAQLRGSGLADDNSPSRWLGIAPDAVEVLSGAPTVDNQGYTTWAYEIDPADQACVPVALTYPIDLGTQDPTAIEDTTLTVVFRQGWDGVYVADPSWSVFLNRTRVGGIGGLSYEGLGVWGGFNWKEMTFPIDPSLRLIKDGVNGVLLAPSYRPQEWSHACVMVAAVKLKGKVDDLTIVELSPKNGAKNVDFDRPGIRVKFSQPFDPDSVNANTLQVFYIDQSSKQQYVAGYLRPDPSDNAVATFTPGTKLKDGVRYFVRVTGETEAALWGSGQWVQSAAGSPLKRGGVWSFETLPDLHVELVPVQVVEGVKLVMDKPTVLKTFVRWEKRDEVSDRERVNKVEVDDIKVSWKSFPAIFTDEENWRKGSADWVPLRDANTAMRRREYRQFTDKSESYDKFEKTRSKDSVNFFGFTPQMAMPYTLVSEVSIKTDTGATRVFSSTVTVWVQESKPFRVHFQPVAKGAWQGRTTPVDLSKLIGDSLSRIKAVWPAASVPPMVANTSVMTLYTPTYDSWLYIELTDVAVELSQMCVRLANCDLMVGIGPKAWLGAGTPGHSEAENTLGGDRARRGVLAADTAVGPVWDFVVAHEAGHVAHDTWDWDDEPSPFVPAGEGYDVSARHDNRRSVALMEPQRWAPTDIHNFMKATPENELLTPLWIAKDSYEILLGDYAVTAANLAAVSTEPLILASGIIAVPTDTVSLTPMYLLDAGPWKVPPPGIYSFSLLDNADNVLASYPFGPGASDPPGPSYFGFKVPFPPGAAKVQIGHGASVLAQVAASANAPSLSITSPAPGVAWSGARTIAWTDSDLDGNSLRYAVDVSADNGATWQPLAINATATSLAWETRSITSTTTALVRVSATDGLRTTTRTAGPFTVANPPDVTYISPSAGVTNANTTRPIVIAFSDDMDPATINTTTIAVRGGPFSPMPGSLTYASAAREATFIPRALLAYSTDYTITVGTGVRSKGGTPLAAGRSSSFRTEADLNPPEPLSFSPPAGELETPLNTSLAVVWDKDLMPGTLTAISFTLATTAGVPLAGAVGYDAATKTATFTPSANLISNTLYVATLKPGLQDTAGNATISDYRWSFWSGTKTIRSVAFTRSFADDAVDDDGDGLFDRLIIRVGVQVTATGGYSVSGVLVDAEGELLAEADAGAQFQPGVRFINLVFPGGPIGGHGVEGPYTLKNLIVYKSDDIRIADSLSDAYRTSAYGSSQFYSRLTLSGLPDVQLLPNGSLPQAFNVKDFARHLSLPSGSLTYLLTMYTKTEAGVTLSADGYIDVHPETDWTGSAEITILASDGTSYAQDSFLVSVGWQYNVNLPVVFKGSAGGTLLARSNWKTVFFDTFEGSMGWFNWSNISPAPGEPAKWYKWAIKDCLAFSGTHSAWPFGGDDGSLLPCGANYPNGYEAYLEMQPSINLKYVGAADFRLKVWTNLDQGDSICALATTDERAQVGMPRFYGVCKTGQSQGWEDLVLDLANVPTLGNLLGREKIWVAIRFTTNAAGTRPVGAYVDDATLRVCPAVLTCR